jgi:glycosyltransferase involved in cell wall biosynthesis
MPANFNYSQILLVSLAKKDSLSWTVPCKVQAYFAAGKPVVASLDGEGARIVNESGAGRACPAEDSQSLAASILELHAMSSSERGEMGKKRSHICGKALSSYENCKATTFIFSTMIINEGI